MFREVIQEGQLWCFAYDSWVHFTWTTMTWRLLSHTQWVCQYIYLLVGWVKDVLLKTLSTSTVYRTSTRVTCTSHQSYKHTIYLTRSRSIKPGGMVQLVPAQYPENGGQNPTEPGPISSLSWAWFNPFWPVLGGHGTRVLGLPIWREPGPLSGCLVVLIRPATTMRSPTLLGLRVLIKIHSRRPAGSSYQTYK